MALTSACRSSVRFLSFSLPLLCNCNCNTAPEFEEEDEAEFVDGVASTVAALTPCRPRRHRIRLELLNPSVILGYVAAVTALIVFLFLFLFLFDRTRPIHGEDTQLVFVFYFYFLN